MSKYCVRGDVYFTSNMAAHEALFSSHMKFFSSQLRCWIKQQVCCRLWHFSPSSIQNCSSQIHRRTCSSIPHGVPYQQQRTVSEHHEEIKLHNDDDNSDSRPVQKCHILTATQTTTGLDRMKINKEGSEHWCMNTERNIKMSRGHESIRNTDPFSNQSEPVSSSETELLSPAKPKKLVNIYADASGRYGLGCVWDKKWIVSQWEDEWLSHNYRCMELLEMKAILVAILTWGHDWAGSLVRIHCDNKMVVGYFNHKAPRLHRQVSKAYVSIKLAAAELGFELVVEQANKFHVRFQGPDSLSKLDFCRFHKLLPYMNSVPDFPPSDLEFLLPNVWENVCVSVKLRSQDCLIGLR